MGTRTIHDVIREFTREHTLKDYLGYRESERLMTQHALEDQITTLDVYLMAQRILDLENKHVNQT